MRSIYAQTDGAFRVVVCSDQRPLLDFEPDERTEFLPAVSLQSKDFNTGQVDKGMKVDAIAQWLAKRGGGYFMPLDADDFVSVRLVEFVRSTQDPNGYLVEDGYALDAVTNVIAPLPGRRYDHTPFHQICGSSAIIRLAPEDLVDGVDGSPSRYKRLFAVGHVSVAGAAAAEGRPLRLIPFRATVYVTNHGLNSTTRAEAESSEFAEGRRRLVDGINHGGVPVSQLAAEFCLPLRYPVGAPPPPALSVAVATYRRPAALRRLLSALRPQVEDKPGREIVVVNDGSHDDAYDQVRADFAGLIKYRALPRNVGIAAARNAAAELASGDYLVYTDDDCVPPPWWLDWLAARLAASPGLDIIAGYTRPLERPRETFLARVQSDHAIIPKPTMSSSGVLFVTANVAIRRKLLSECGGFGFPGFRGASEDTELSSRLRQHGATFFVDPKWYVHHEVGDSLVTMCRRHWRYGYANAAMMALTTSPAANDGLGWYRRRRHVRNWLEAFREQRRLSAASPRGPAVRLLSSFVASLVRLAYFDGCAVALNERERRRAAGEA
jgi:glycosyltransferase involved in cell wall biosynthesis